MFSRFKLKCLLEQFQFEKNKCVRATVNPLANTFSLILLVHTRNKTATEKIYGTC